MKKVYYQLTLILAILVMTGVFNIFPAKGETLLTSIKYNDVPTMASDSLPFVVVVKKGKAIKANIGTVEGHDAHERKMNEKEKRQLRKIYDAMFE